MAERTDWNPVLRAEFAKPYWGELQQFVAGERTRTAVYPPHDQVFAALHLTPYEDVKVLILGQDPYHGAGQAHGLCFSVQTGVPAPPSLVNIFKELHDDLGIDPPSHGCLDAWAKQGVLLLNATLTVRAGNAASHQGKGWETFTDEVIRAVNDKPERVVFILWGASARKKKGLVDTSRHVVIESPHPSPLSAHNGFFGSKPFSRANAALVEAGREPVDWRPPGLGSGSMRAVVLNGMRDVSVEEVPDAGVPGPDGLLLRVERTAICGSDLHLYHGPMNTPGVHLGHEFVGTVEEIGSGVQTVKKGDRVLVSGVIGCGVCPPCRAGDVVVCRNQGTKVFGTSLELAGGQAEAVAVPAADASVVKIPEGITTEQAVLLTDILPTGYLGAQRADITPGDTVVVIGLGPVGVFALQCAQLFGPARILAVDMVPDRLARAAELGAEPIDASDGDTVAKVLEATGGRGAEAVIEAVGADQTITDAIFCAAPGGTISVVGVSMNFAFPLPNIVLLMKRLTLRMTLASIPTTWMELFPLVETGKLKPEEVFTHRLGLSEAAEAYRIFEQREDGVLKVLMDPSR